MNRREQLLGFLEKNRFLTIKQLAQGLHVSEMTIRRDIALLAKASKVKTFYGGVSLNTVN